MAFTPDLTINDASAVATSFNLVSTAGNQTIRKDPSRAVDSPRLMTVSHSVSGKVGSQIDRHLIRFDQTEVDASDETHAEMGSAHIVLTKPRGVITSTHIKDLIAFLTNYLAIEANIDKVLNGEPG